MARLLSIGEFSRMTHLSVKALRHYDDVGLLQPAAVDASSGYRRYAVAQVPSAQVIRRFRDLDMPLDRIKDVLDAPDAATRDRIIVDHLAEMERKLDQTQVTVASLRMLLEGSATGAIDHRSIAPVRAVAVRARVKWDDAEAWLSDAFDAIRATIARIGAERCGPDGALYAPAFFEAHDGDVLAFAPARAVAHDDVVDVPGGMYAVTVHEGSFATLDTAYAALGTHVTERAIGADGPIREHYVVSGYDADDEHDWRTEVCWPIR
jgi:DNA-binding transcriptional MerR regulator